MTAVMECLDHLRPVVGRNMVGVEALMNLVDRSEAVGGNRQRSDSNLEDDDSSQYPASPHYVCAKGKSCVRESCYDVRDASGPKIYNSNPSH